MDEVQCGAGRTGRMWAVEHTGVKPEMLTFGKSIGRDVPMAGIAMRSELAARISDGSVSNTFAANSLLAAVALTNLEILYDTELGLIPCAELLGQEIQDRVRGKGLMIGIELVEDKATKEPLAPEKVGRVMEHLLGHGVLIVPCGRYGNVMRVMHLMAIWRRLLHRALDVFGEGLASL